MKILTLTDNQEKGGANVAAWRLIEAFCERGIHVFHGNLTGKQDPVIQHENYRTIPLMGNRMSKVASGVKGVGVQFAGKHIEKYDTIRQLELNLERLNPDILHIHNLHKCEFALEILEAIPADQPVVWTLHDTWSFTGRCVYSFDCRNFVSGDCDEACPTAAEYPALKPSLIRSALKRKRDWLTKKNNVIACCPSSWMTREANSGLWAGRAKHIRNCVPLESYYPIEKEIARRALNLDAGERPVFVSVAAHWTDERKGGKYLHDALEQLKTPAILLLMGNERGKLNNELIEVRSLGFLHDDLSKAIVYSAADILLHPAPVDNLPNVVAEAACCGTPILSFDTCGLPEMVAPGETGWLSPEVSPESFLKTLREAIADREKWGVFSMAVRSRAEVLYGSDQVTDTYLEVFKELSGRQ